jgi:heme/copper-type cytochrome/quinol oxidase subunit 2
MRTPVWGNFELLQFYPRNWQTGFTRSGHSLLIYISMWQYWLWFTFIFLLNVYFVFLFRCVTYRRADMRGRRAVGDKRRSAWPELFTCVFPFVWCINILNNSLIILKTVEINGGYTLLTIQIMGFQWGWRYGYGELNYTRMLAAPIYVGNDSLIRPGRNYSDDVYASYHNSFIAEARFMRKWVGESDSTLEFGLDNIKVPLFRHGLWISAQGEQVSATYTSYFFNSNKEYSYDPLRLLRATDAFVLPTHQTIRLLATAEDVTHSWAVPGLGLKLDCVPGRLYVTFVNINREGVYYGQCSELCGWNHFNMPIVLYAIAYEHFLMWWALELHAIFLEKSEVHPQNYYLINLKYK